MDSPSVQLATPSRNPPVRSHPTFAAQSPVNHRGAVRKRANDNARNRSISLSQPDRLYCLAAGQQADFKHPVPSTAGAIPWITPQSSPQPQPFTPEHLIEPFLPWTAPTPPRSDSGIPTLSVDANEDAVTTGISVAADFAFEQPSTSSEMRSLGFLLPSTYGGGPYGSESNSYAIDPNPYIPPMRMSQPTTTGGSAAYAHHTSSSSPALYQSRTSDASGPRRHSEMAPAAAGGSPYDQGYRRVSNLYDEAGYSMPSSQNIPSISGLTQSPLPPPGLNQTAGAQQMMPPYDTNSMSRSPHLYPSNPYGQHAYTTASAPPPMHAPSQQPSMSYTPPFVGSGVNEAMAKRTSTDSSIRVLTQRPKPQCWEHGCNGRAFSTFSNLLRHQREKSGTASKSYCPKCGAEFTRTTARNGHLAHDKCTKQRRASEGQ